MVRSSKGVTVYSVDEYSLETVLQTTKNDKEVLGLEYIGERTNLWSVEEVEGGKQVYTKIRIEGEIDEETISKLSQRYPTWVRVVVQLDREYRDMRNIQELTGKYPNISFCGAGLLRLMGCSIGCIQKQDCSGYREMSTHTFDMTCCSSIPLQESRCYKG